MYAANTVLCAKAGPLRMRRANSVIQQDRMRKRNDVLLENALFSRRRKLDFKDQSLFSAQEIKLCLADFMLFDEKCFLR